MSVKKYTQEMLKALTPQELEDKAVDEQAQLAKMRFNHAITPLADHNELRFQRRNIARLKTELRARS